MIASRASATASRAVRFLASVVVGLAASFACADVVHTSDGSRLIGIIEGVTDGKLLIVTEIAGRLEIDAEKITAIAVDKPVHVAFDTGDRLVGTVTFDPDQQRCIMHTALGDVEVDPAKITALWQEGAESPEVIALRKEVERTRAELTPDWTTTLEIGANATEGNTKTLTARGRLDVVRKTVDDLLKFYVAAEYNESNDRRTKNEYRGGVAFEHSMTHRWYWYTRLDMEFDEFESLDLRSTAAAGGGYYWLRTPEREVKNRFGLGYRHESFDTGRTVDAAVIDLGLDLRLDLAPWGRLTHSTTYSPDFLEFNDYRVDLDTALGIPLAKDGWTLKIGMRNEYNSRPQKGIDRLDNTFYANLAMKLKHTAD